MWNIVIRLRAFYVCFSLQCCWFKVTKKHCISCTCIWCIICLIYSSSTFLITHFNLSWSVLQETCSQSNRKPWQLSHCACSCLNEASWAPLLSHWFRYWLHIKDLFLRGALFTARLKVNEFPEMLRKECVCVFVCACVCVCLRVRKRVRELVLTHLARHNALCFSSFCSREGAENLVP